jgi:cytochrome c oxidase cbb3-type subunit 3
MTLEGKDDLRPDRKDDRLLDHQYDGIQEYDNPLPRWWVMLFWATIVYSLLYMIDVPGLGNGQGRIAAYERDMAAARAKYGDRVAPTVSETDLLALIEDALQVAEGKKVYDLNCMPCHRADGGGMIGPNLTDDYWIHGGRPLEVLATVSQGVPQKGMPSWGQVMKPEQVGRVVAYVLTLHGTRPANGKGPEGLRADSVTASASGDAAGPDAAVPVGSTVPSPSVLGR